nr:unnamed protein product [Naegleria fowleri]
MPSHHLHSTNMPEERGTTSFGMRSSDDTSIPIGHHGAHQQQQHEVHYGTSSGGGGGFGSQQQQPLHHHQQQQQQQYGMVGGHEHERGTTSQTQQTAQCPLGFGSGTKFHSVSKEAALQFGRVPLSGQSIVPQNVLTRDNGCPVGHVKDSMTAGSQGPLCVGDLDLLEKLLHFNCEKIPPRNVHALGCGAYGTFTVTNDIRQYTSADLFSEVGKKTEFITRFSGIFTEVGDADTTRDPRGFAIKFYTCEGNWDLLGINTPVFAVRDAKPDAVHAFKRDPRTGCWNVTQTWDFVASHPEGLHQMVMLFTDRTGTPMSYRTMNAYGCHTFSFVNDKKERFWVKFHLKCMQGAYGFTQHEAKLVAGEDPNFLSRDLYQAIEKGNYPKWKMYIQIMPEEEGYRHPWTFDPTKIWKHSQYPLIEVGELEVNRNVTDYFCEVEQVAFSPSNTVPGIGLSPDKLLQGRLLIYDSTQIHRIGPNYRQLYVNRPLGVEPQNYNVGGQMNLRIQDKFPGYDKSVFGGLVPNAKYIDPPFRCTGNAGLYEMYQEGSYEDYYQQVADFWRILSDKEKNNLCDNIASSFFKVTEQRVIDRMMQHFQKCDPMWAQMIELKLRERKEGKYMTEGEKICMDYTTRLLKLTQKQAL